MLETEGGLANTQNVPKPTEKIVNINDILKVDLKKTHLH